MKTGIGRLMSIYRPPRWVNCVVLTKIPLLPFNYLFIDSLPGVVLKKETIQESMFFAGVGVNP